MIRLLRLQLSLPAPRFLLWRHGPSISRAEPASMRQSRQRRRELGIVNRLVPRIALPVIAVIIAAPAYAQMSCPAISGPFVDVPCGSDLNTVATSNPASTKFRLAANCTFNQ